MAITLSKQYNFKLNEATMEQARNIIKEKGMTMTDAISLFIEQIVLGAICLLRRPKIYIENS